MRFRVRVCQMYALRDLRGRKDTPPKTNKTKQTFATGFRRIAAGLRHVAYWRRVSTEIGYDAAPNPNLSG